MHTENDALLNMMWSRYMHMSDYPFGSSSSEESTDWQLNYLTRQDYVECNLPHHTLKHPKILTCTKISIQDPELHEGVLRDGRVFRFCFDGQWVTLGIGATLDDVLSDEFLIQLPAMDILAYRTNVNERHALFISPGTRETWFERALQRRLSLD